MKVLVTGGLGHVGSALARELRGRGHEVWTLDLGHAGHVPNYLKCDVGRYRQVERVFEGRRFDHVYHLAAEFGRWNGEDYYETLWTTNAVGAKNVIRMQERHGFRLILFSSSEVYGDHDGVMSEDVPEKFPIRHMNDYAMTKWINEMQAMNSAEAFGTETVRVRLFNTYGPGEFYSPYRSALCIFMYHALHDLPYTVYTGHHRTSTYVTDTARTLANIPENFLPGEVYNVGGLEYHDMKEASDIVLNHLGKSDELVTYEEGEPHTTRDKRVDVAKAFRDLGHDPRVPLDEGIPRTVEWMKSVYTG